jgi:hypothetical protein
MAQEIRISKAGYNALTEAEKNNYIFHSTYNTFKILAEGSLTTQAVSADPTTFQVAHGKSYTPAIMAFIKFPDGYVTLPQGGARSNVPPTYRYWVVEVDATNIYFMVYKGGGANYNVDIHYYVFETPSN